MTMIAKTAVVLPQSNEYVSWSNSYSMGVKLIDDQHKGLLVFVNDLFNHVTGNEEDELVYFKEVIHKAIQYVKDHFQTEEKMMIATRFSGYGEHKKVHDEFTMMVVKSVKEFEEGKRLVLEKFAHYLKDWVLTHIAIMDRQYADYFRRIATRKADGRLTISNADIG